MSQSDDVFKKISGEVVKNYLEPSDNKSANTRFWYALLGVLFFVGSEAVKVIFRKNFGKKGIDTTRIVLCSIVFILIGVFAFFLSKSNNHSFAAENQTEFLIAAIFYIILSVYVLVKGFGAIEKAQKNDNAAPNYKGDSELLSFLITEGGNQSTVQNLAEPFLLIVLGLFLASFNFLLGLPLMFCGVSVWVEQVLEKIFGVNQVQETLNQKGYNQNQSDSFTEAKF